MIDYQLTGKTAIVTGGVSGIGLAVAQTRRHPARGSRSGT